MKPDWSPEYVVGWLRAEVELVRKKVEVGKLTHEKIKSAIFRIARVRGMIACRPGQFSQCPSVLPGLDELLAVLNKLRPPVSLPQRASVITALDELSGIIPRSDQ